MNLIFDPVITDVFGNDNVKQKKYNQLVKINIV